MSEPFVGEIRMFGGNFAPRGWALCDGQLLSVSQNDALFSLLGTIYGGDGRTTFGLPDMRGRLPVHMGQGPGLSARPIGQRIGTEYVTLTSNQIPDHDHPFYGSSHNASSATISGHVYSTVPTNDLFYAPAHSDPSRNVSLYPGTISNTGGSRQHSNQMPALAVSFIIALVGIYPSRN